MSWYPATDTLTTADAQLNETTPPFCCRVEPTGDSDTFIVHGQACIASDAHPTCTHDPHSKVPPAGRTYTMDITNLMGPTDLPVCVVQGICTSFKWRSQLCSTMKALSEPHLVL